MLATYQVILLSGFAMFGLFYCMYYCTVNIWCVEDDEPIDDEFYYVDF